MTLSLKFNKNITTNKKYYTFGTDPKSNRKIAERGKIDTHNTNTRPLID